nr:hypothetical protein [uncultured Mediterraneibacter sp.]
MPWHRERIADVDYEPERCNEIGRISCGLNGNDPATAILGTEIEIQA